jgi:putative flippase GtrA
MSELWLASRFIAAGLVNTTVGIGVILALDVGLGLRPAIANAVGYAIGICIAWVMHRRFVFRTTETGWKVKARYLATVTLAFALNQVVLAGVGHVTGGAPEARIVAQVLAVVTYSAVQFILMRTWVFRTGALRRG